MLSATLAVDPVAAFAQDVRAGLSKSGQKELPSKYLYDTLGSKLFETICELPEYGLTRADERILQSCAREIARRIPGDVVVCELGSGSGRKTRFLLEAISRGRRINYYPIEISHSALAICERDLRDIESVGIVGLEREYLDGLREVRSSRRPGQRILVLFLGSTIGNFSQPCDETFLRDVRAILSANDLLVLGTDLDKTIRDEATDNQALDEKAVRRMTVAYDDPLGVTAAFNLNLLARINRELDADFDLARFEHMAKFNPETRSIEMHIRSRSRQKVTIPKSDFSVAFDEGETIWTENSHKYSLPEVSALAGAAGFRKEAQWVDAIWPFAETLFIAQ